MAAELGKEYCESKKIKGLPDRALNAIGEYLKKFDEADTDRNGTLSKDEVKVMLSTDESYGGADVELFMSDLDEDKDGQITRDEWLHKIIVNWARRTYIPHFNKLDKTGRNLVPKDDVIQVFTNEGYSADELTEFIQTTDPDGLVDYKDFIARFFNVNK